MDSNTSRLASLGPMSARDQLYRSDTNKTFENESILPSLPVPDLGNTFRIYLDTVKPVVSAEEYQATEAIVEKFLATVGPRLQESLLRRGLEKRNWLEDWWLEYAYLRQRSSLIPYSNMAAPHPVADYWPPQTGSRVERVSLTLAFNLEFWKMLRSETMRPMVHRGVPWAMDQFKRLFNTVRVPGEEKDELRSIFLTEAEGPLPPTNVIVMYRGYIFSFEAIDRAIEEPLTPKEIAHQLGYIEEWCKSQASDGPGLGALTTLDRSSWAKYREYLMNLHPQNADSLKKIEESLLILSLDDQEPLTQGELLQEAMCGDCTNRWADKSMTTIAFKNGLMAGNGDHTPFDGLCTAILTHYIVISLDECQGVWKGINKFKKMPKAEKLDFVLDDRLYKEIHTAKEQFKINCSDIDIVHSTFDGFGKSALRSHKFHPEAFTQIALQLAYYRIHGKPAPTYCTASTRQYYHGRTETCRSCFPESIEFVKAALGNNHSRAVEKFQDTMKEAMKGYGCDRHLLGLYLTAVEQALELPELFIDPSFVKSGGGGNYILSTSCSGYWSICGGVPPMREDGYATFYGIEDDRITFCVIAYKKCDETEPRTYFKNITSSLLDMQRIISSAKL